MGPTVAAAPRRAAHAQCTAKRYAPGRCTAEAARGTPFSPAVHQLHAYAMSQGIVKGCISCMYGKQSDVCMLGDTLGSSRMALKRGGINTRMDKAPPLHPSLPEPLPTPVMPTYSFSVATKPAVASSSMCPECSRSNVPPIATLRQRCRGGGEDDDDIGEHGDDDDASLPPRPSSLTAPATPSRPPVSASPFPAAAAAQAGPRACFRRCALAAGPSVCQAGPSSSAAEGKGVREGGSITSSKPSRAAKRSA